MKFKVQLEWVRDYTDIVRDAGGEEVHPIESLRARIDRDDGSELCTIEHDRPGLLMFYDEGETKELLKEAMSKSLHEFAVKQLG